MFTKEKTLKTYENQKRDRGKKMGVPHLENLRDFLEKNADKAFTRTVLRDTLKQNFDTVKQNLAYLIDKEKVVIRIEGKQEMYQWKGDDTNGKLPKKESSNA